LPGGHPQNKIQRRRRDISVEQQSKDDFSPIRAAYSAMPLLTELWEIDFTKRPRGEPNLPHGKPEWPPDKRIEETGKNDLPKAAERLRVCHGIVGDGIYHV